MSIVRFFLLIVCLTPINIWADSASPTSYRVLIINSWSKELPWQLSVENGIRAELDRRGQPYEIFAEYLDADRFDQDFNHDALSDFLNSKYQTSSINLIIADSLPAVSFLIEHPSLLPGTPRVYLPDSDFISEDGIGENDVVIPVTEDYVSSVNEAIRRSGATQLYVVGESFSEGGKNQLRRFKQAFSNTDLDIRYLENLSMPQLIEETAKLPPNSAIFYLLVFKDSLGMSYIPYQAANILAKNANAPIFSLWRSLMGSGIVGGYLLSGERLGAMAIRHAFLKAHNISLEPNLSDAYGHYLDERQLKKHRISKQALPETTTLLFSAPSFWKTHQLEIVLTFFLLILLSLLTGILIVVNRKRQRAIQALMQERRLLEQRVADRTQALHDAKIQAETDARTDVLTGLNNRRAFYEHGRFLHEQATRYHNTYSVLLIDVDLFKEVNDVYGHDVGDRVLKQIANIIRQSIRNSDIPGRIGGDEFAVLLPHSAAHKMTEFAERIRSAVAQSSITIDSKAIKLTVSIGIAEFHSAEEMLDGVIKRADVALYEAKNNGRNNIALYRETK